MKLVVDYCTHNAAKYAVKTWHYSKRLPMPPMVFFGVWENDDFKGVVIFGRGANKSIGTPYGLKQTECIELVRVALREHESPVSKIVSIAIKKLKNKENIRLLVSYADPEQSHVGVIYQAMNWVYVGKGKPSKRLLYKNKLLHGRQFSTNGIRTQYGKLVKVPRPQDGKIIIVEGKHKYLYPMDRAMKRQISKLSKPYPKA